MKLGIDLGGTKTEIIALDETGKVLLRRRQPSPKGDFSATVDSIAHLVLNTETELGLSGSLGLGIPGTLSPQTGLVKNANSTWLNGQDLKTALEQKLSREIRIANDANCLAVSESVDGAGAGHKLVFAVIIGTGCGAGIAINQRVHAGGNGIGGEWGHNPLPWISDSELSTSPTCYCGKRGCIETFLSGSGFAQRYQQTHSCDWTSEQIVAASAKGDSAALTALSAYRTQLARALAGAVNLLDPDVIVLAGGMSNIDAIYPQLDCEIRAWCFGGEFDTPIRRAKHGDSSGVRGAAWLWND